jgi:hypothetical protein
MGKSKMKGFSYLLMEISILVNIKLEVLKVMASTIGRTAPTIEASFYQE